ncbi:TPA: PLDc_N domain-containing protein [archaeon]|uniref:PLDc_N domain-containing protein n=1 Tax=Candidatus Naiadarchaeum limnaeum TaxID=2756139 RepID=A0A832V198_9ARCH|nr:PLDc_N domain-containing protein [Candidatus Naiadarchaeales archaeon SRR2090153.bin1042]HIK01009.1 PLDc_N domain-containing protein [Candidatus Naiadarchaeum limnaeum]
MLFQIGAGPAIAGAAFGAIFFVIFILALVILSLVGVIWAVIDIIRAKNEGDNWKVIWILVVVILGILGVAIYYFVGRKERISPGGGAPASKKAESARANPKAVKYIKEQRSAGYTTPEIRSELKEAGYSNDEIDASFRQAKGGD